jgi:hypothetical protein
MVRDLAQGLVFLPDEPDGPRLVPDGPRLVPDGPRVRRGGRVRRRRVDLAPRRDPVGEERS